MNPQGLVENAVQEMRERALIPHESSVESKLELIVGSGTGESVLRTCEPATSNIKDIAGLRSLYSFLMEPLGIILCHDRDLICFLDVLNDEVAVEAITGGAERLIVVAGHGGSRHGWLGEPEGVRIAFAGLTKKRTCMLALIVPRSPNSSFEEAESGNESHPLWEWHVTRCSEGWTIYRNRPAHFLPGQGQYHRRSPSSMAIHLARPNSVGF